MPLSQADGKVNVILNAAKNKEPMAFIIAALLALYVLYVISRIALRWSNTPRASERNSERKRPFLGPSDIVGAFTAVLALGALLAILVNLAT